MPKLPSGLELRLSRDYIAEPDDADFPCQSPPHGHFYYWTPDPQVNTPPFEAGVVIVRQIETATVPATREEVKRYIHVLIGQKGNDCYWRGDWLNNFPKPGDLDEADRLAWESWLAQQGDFLDETIELCRRQTEVAQAMGQRPTPKFDPLGDIGNDLLKALAPLADLSGTTAAVRLALAGAKFDLGKLQARGLELVHEDQDYRVGDIPLDLSGRKGLSRIEARCWFSPAGYLRDLHVYGYTKEGDEGRVSLDDLGIQTSILTDLFTSAQLAPYAAAADEEWEILRDNYHLKEERSDMTPEMQRAAILECRLGDLVQTDCHRASRFVTGILRFVAHWPSTWLLGKVAEHAAQAGLRREAAGLAVATLGRTDLDGQTWNHLGCVFHYLGMLQEALRCFLMTVHLSPDEKVYRNNVLLETKPVLRNLLKDRQLGLAVGMAEAVLDSSATDKPDDLAFLHGVVALGCEFIGDDTYARSAWERAKAHEERFLPANAALRRMAWRDLSARRRVLDAQLAAFPRLPEEVGSAERVPIRFTEGDDHGSHWKTIVPNVEEFLSERLGQVVREAHPHGSRDYLEDELPLSGIANATGFEYGEAGPVRYYLLVSTDRDSPERHQLFSSYPFGLEGPVCRMRVIELMEWPGGIEGHVEACTPQGKCLSFFAPRYFLERSLYHPGLLHDFRLVGFANSIEPFAQKSWEITEGPAVELERERAAREDPETNVEEINSVQIHLGEDPAVLEPSLTYPDEYGYYLRVESVGWFTLEGRRGCQLGTTFMKCGDGEALRGALYAVEHVLNGYEPKVGDRIEGRLWLQGHLASDKAHAAGKAAEDEGGEAHRGGLISWINPAAVNEWENPKIPVDDAQEFAVAIFRSYLAEQPEVERSLELPGRVPLEPETAVGLRNGRRVFVCVRGYDLDVESRAEDLAGWIQARQALADRKGLTPVFFVHVGRRVSGKGFALEYQGAKELQEALRALAQTEPEEPEQK